jgi:hypothetical protein
MTSQEQLETHRKHFEHLNALFKGIEVAFTVKSESTNGEPAEPTSDDTMQKLQILTIGHLNLISQQLFWIQGRIPAELNSNGSD